MLTIRGKLIYFEHPFRRALLSVRAVRSFALRRFESSRSLQLSACLHTPANFVPNATVPSMLSLAKDFFRPIPCQGSRTTIEQTSRGAEKLFFSMFVLSFNAALSIFPLAHLRALIECFIIFGGLFYSSRCAFW